MNGFGRQASLVTVRMPGTCGELVQGVLQGVSFHVTCPVDLFAEVTVSRVGSFCPDGRRNWSKAREAMARTLVFLGAPRTRLGLTIRSEIPRGKGMGSSTADVAGAIVATAELARRPLDLRTVARLALSVEPTDGSLFPGIVCFDHREGLILESLGEALPLAILVLDFGGRVDTVAFNLVDRRSLLAPMEGQFREALAMVRAGVAHRDAWSVGEGASLSAECNQRILPKPFLPAVRREGQDVGAVGVCVAHSGTAVGLLLEAGRDDLAQIRARLVRRLPGLQRTWLTCLVSGGIRPVSCLPEGHGTSRAQAMGTT
ncbi:MAG: GHMP kinase [candidate division NC10 bacterium]|nr:GHMP kinase [candidate division NC10 bacterium]